MPTIPTVNTLRGAHPLAAGLVALYLPGIDLIDRTGIGPTLIRGTGAQNGTTADGPALRSVQSGSRCHTPTMPAAWRLTTAGTLYWRGAITGTPAGDTAFWGNTTPDDTAPYRYYSLNTDNAGRLRFVYSAGEGVIDANIGPTVAAGFTSAAASFTVGGPINLYIAGTLLNTVTWAGGAPGYANTPHTCVGGDFFLPDRRINGDTNIVGTWNRALSAAEIATLDADPYAMLRAPPTAAVRPRVVGSRRGRAHQASAVRTVVAFINTVTTPANAVQTETGAVWTTETGATVTTT